MKKAIVATLALGAVVSSAGAQNLSLQGSDTLYDVTQGMLSLCQISPTNMLYIGGGSGTGENAIEARTQQIAPMSRFLDAAACGRPAPLDQGQGIAHSLDAIGIFTDDTEQTGCNTLRYTGFMEVAPAANGNGTLECPNCVDGPDGDGVLDHYQFTEWQQALRIIYAGRHAPIAPDACNQGDPPAVPAGETKVCDSDVRYALVNNWANMFETGCADGECTQLKHAWRRDDLSGTTDTFLSLLSLPAITATTPPFCNGTEFEDNDPIRRDCDGNGQSTNGENVCNRTEFAREGAAKASPTNSVWSAVTAANAPSPAAIGDLGLVLPIVMPAVAADQFPNQNPCAALGFGGQFKFAPMALSTLPPAQQLCPNGTARAWGGCLWPVDASGNFGCVNSSTNRPVGVTGFANTMDGRVYNLTPRRLDGTIPTVARRQGTATVQRPLVNVGFYRIHQRTLQTNATGDTCRQPDATEQIGCLVHASPCSLGFAGLAADTQVPNRALNLATPDATQAVAPTATNARRLLQSCATGDFEIRYPLSRKLWLNTVVGFNNVTNNSQTGLLTQEAQLVRCFKDRRFIDRAARTAGFITIDDANCSTLALPNPADIDFATPAQCRVDSVTQDCP